jgi:hypothetical protein
MAIVLFALLLGVWAALVIPSVIRSRRENAVTSRPQAHRDESRAAAAHRAQVLARRRTALIVLGVAVIGTLAAAIITGSWPVLAVSLVVDVVLAAYVAILLQIKQGKGTGAAPGRFGNNEGDVQVYRG